MLGESYTSQPDAYMLDIVQENGIRKLRQIGHIPRKTGRNITGQALHWGPQGGGGEGRSRSCETMEGEYGKRLKTILV